MTILEAHYDPAIHDAIRSLAAERNAVILAHNYERPEIQDVADYVGDSLGLSREAAKTSADVIVFCGVHFMAETAAILSPQKTVLLPDLAAGCSLASTINAEQLRAVSDYFERLAEGMDRIPAHREPADVQDGWNGGEDEKAATAAH